MGTKFAMNIVPMYFARLPSEIKPGKTFRTRHRMTLEDIQRASGTPIELDVEMREVATTEKEMRLRLNSVSGQYLHRR